MSDQGEVKTTRQEFEDWVFPRWSNLRRFDGSSFLGEGYENHNVQFQWEAWQASERSVLLRVAERLKERAKELGGEMGCCYEYAWHVVEALATELSEEAEKKL